MPFTRKLFFNPVDDASISGMPEGYSLENGSNWRIGSAGYLTNRGSKPPAPSWITLKEFNISDLAIQMDVVTDLTSREAGQVFRALNINDFLRIRFAGPSVILHHYQNGVYTELDRLTAATPVADSSFYNSFIVLNGQNITVYKDSVEIGTFSNVAVNEFATLHGFNVVGERADSWGNVAYTNDLTLSQITIAVESEPPVLTVVDGFVELEKNSQYTETSTAIDNQDGDISQFIEYYNTSDQLLSGIDTSIIGATDYILKVRDNNFNYAIATKNVNVISPLAAIQEQNRVSSNRHNIDKHASRIQLSIENETGFNDRLVQLHKNDDVSYVLNNALVEFNNGVAEIEVNVPPSFPYLGHIVDSANFPQNAGKAVVGATVGELNCYANELIQVPGLMPESGVIFIDGQTVTGNELNFISAKGASCNYEAGLLIYCPGGAFDHLDPGETDTDVINYTVSGNIQRAITINILASDALGSNVANTLTEETITHAFEEGATYEVAFTVAGRTVGAIRPVADGTVDFVPDYALSKNAREVWHLKIPAACSQIVMQKDDGFDGTISALHVRELLKPEVVVPPRKLEVSQVNQRQQPADARVEGTCVIQPKLVPLYDPSSVAGIAWVEDISNTTLGFPGGRLGYRSSSKGNYRFVDVKSYEKKEAIALYDGGDLAYIDNLWAEGGFPTTEAGRWEFELGVSFGTTSGGQFKSTYMLNSYVDMKRDSINGQYSGPNNTDCTVINRDYGTQTLQWEQTSYFYNCAYYNGGDGGIDAKTIVITNHMEVGYHWLNYRCHSRGIQIHCNSNLLTYGENWTVNYSGGSFWVGYNNCRVLAFNSYADGVRLVDMDDTVGVIDGSSNNNDDASGAFIIMKTQPRMSDAAKSAFDEMEGQYKLSTDSTWIDLPKFSVGHSGDFMWRPTLPAGTYDFRCRTIIRTQSSAWVEALGVELV